MYNYAYCIFASWKNPCCNCATVIWIWPKSSFCGMAFCHPNHHEATKPGWTSGIGTKQSISCWWNSGKRSWLKKGPSCKDLEDCSYETSKFYKTCTCEVVNRSIIYKNMLNQKASLCINIFIILIHFVQHQKEVAFFDDKNLRILGF